MADVSSVILSGAGDPGHVLGLRSDPPRWAAHRLGQRALGRRQRGAVERAPGALKRSGPATLGRPRCLGGKGVDRCSLHRSDDKFF